MGLDRSGCGDLGFGPFDHHNESDLEPVSTLG